MIPADLKNVVNGARLQLLLLVCLLNALTINVSFAAAEPASDDLQRQAREAFDREDYAEAFAQISRAISLQPNNPSGYFLRARFYAERRESAKAIADYDQVIKLNPRLPQAWQNRGCEHFKLGRIEESIADFDKLIELAPGQAPYHWQRGIACYYAGRFEDGRKQFELHQTVNPQDVENAVWHFLCMARSSSVEKARAALIPISGDSRVPMAEIHALFAGKLKPEDVLKAVDGNRASEGRRPDHKLFYAHLYLGLYYEILGDKKRAREHISKAAGDFQTGDYMGDVARVHLELRWLGRP